MLKIVSRLTDINFSQLMNVYSEANAANGEINYPDLPHWQQIASAEQDLYQYLNEVFFRQENAFYAIWYQESAYISALRIEPYMDGLLLSALETVPFLRKQGYAQMLINSVMHYLSSANSGIVYSHVAKRNIASLAVHKKCGFSVIRDYAVYADGSVLHNSYTLAKRIIKSESTL